MALLILLAPAPPATPADRRNGALAAAADRVPAHARYHPSRLRAVRVRPRRDAGVRALRRAAVEVRRRDREAGVLCPVARRPREARRRQAPRARDAVRSHRAARALRREVRKPAELPVPPL